MSSSASLNNNHNHFFTQVLKKTPILNRYTKEAVLGFELLRSITFTAQNISLNFIQMLATSTTGRFDKKFIPRLQQVYKEIFFLLTKDAENIARGVYPIEVLNPEPTSQFLGRYPKILLDGFQNSRRRLSTTSSQYSPETSEYLRELPDYFQKNFDFRSGGYLTDESAELYDHHAEILYGGVGDAMRRLLLPFMKQHFMYTQGDGLHFLEIAAGTGRMSRFVKLTFPKAKITVMDFSHPYLKKAQANLQEFKKIDFVQGDSANMPFKDQQFDGVFSCFLFHELPMDVRKQTIQEGMRVLKPNGFFGLVDSIQQFDKKDFDWAVGEFPIGFQEPFYKNYTQNPMEGLMQAAGFEKIQIDIGFFSKAVCGMKP